MGETILRSDRSVLLASRTPGSGFVLLHRETAELVEISNVLCHFFYRVTKVLGDTYFVDLKVRFAP